MYWIVLNFNASRVDWSRKTRTAKYLIIHWRGIVLAATPLVFLPIIFNTFTPTKRCLYLFFVITTYYITEALPLGIAAMIPIVFFPVMDILTSNDVSSLYFKDGVVLNLGCCMLAAILENGNLYTRISRWIIEIIGFHPRSLHFAISFISMFLSMWIDTSAVVAFMCPLVKATLKHLETQGLCKIYTTEGEEKEKPSRFALCYYLSICYSAIIGGRGSLVGSMPNYLLRSEYERRFPLADVQVNFTRFMLFSVPTVFVVYLFLNLYLEWKFLGLFQKEGKDLDQQHKFAKSQLLERSYEKLGPMSVVEKTILILIIIFFPLYVTRKPVSFVGWSSIFSTTHFENSSLVIFFVILLFSLPANYNFLKIKKSSSYEKTGSIVEWKLIQQKSPWRLIFLNGSSSVLAEGSRISGMEALLARNFRDLEDLPPWLLLLVAMLVTSLFSNLYSDAYLARMVVPVLLEMALTSRVHPFYLALPGTQAVGTAYLLPTASPSISIVSSYARIKTSQFILNGIFPSVISIFILYIFSLSWGPLVYPIITANSLNITN